MERRVVETLLSMIVVLLAAFISPGSVDAYNYGISPTGASVADADLMTKYNNYKTNYFTSDCGPTTLTRVRFARAGQANADQTVSEGMGYGMLMAAYLESDAAGATVVQNLMNFVKAKYAAPTYLMDWKVTCGGVIGAGPASDGDIDIALALLQAHKRWPGAGFKTQADTLVSRILNNETDPCGLKPGAFGGCNGVINLSYHGMSYFTAFECSGYSGFAGVKTACYAEQQKWVNLNYKLPPDWSNQTTGTWSNYNGSTDRYYYDACRTPWRLSMDYLWYGNAQAQTLCNRIVENFKATDPNPANMGDGYTASTGLKYSYNHNSAFLGPAACGAMVSSAHQSWLDLAYNNLKNLASSAYYQDSLQVITLMVLTGVFTDPSCASGPTYTPTATRSPTSTPTAGPVVSISKSALNNPVHPGETIAYRISFYNTSLYAADSVTIRDTLPSQLIYLSAVPPGTLSGSSYIWTYPSLGVGAAASIVLNCVVDPAAPVSSVIVNSADIYGANLSGVRASPAAVTVRDWFTSISKSASTGSVAVGETFTYTLVYANTSTGADYSQATTGVTLTMHNNNNSITDNNITTYFRLSNNSGAPLTLSNYRITYWWINADHTASEYSTDADYVSTGAVTTARVDVSPGGTGYRQALVVGWSSGTLVNGQVADIQLRTHSSSYSFNENEADDYSFPGVSGTYAANPKVLLEQYKAGTWVYVSGAPPFGAGRTLSGVTLVDRLPNGLSYVGNSGNPAGTYNSGTRNITWAIGTLNPGVRNTLTLLAAGLTNGAETVNTAVLDCAEDSANTSNPVTVRVTGALPTPTPTPGVPFTFTPTRTWTPTSIPPTLTLTPTPSSTVTFTHTPTHTLPPGTTVVETPSFTSTPTWSRTWTATYTWSPTGTVPLTFTPTPTWSPTFTYSFTLTYTPTFTFTHTPTETPPSPPTGTPTGIVTIVLPTATPMIPPGAGVTVSEPYPNPPKDGREVQWVVRTGAPTVLRWTVYSTALRKVREAVLNIHGASVISWDLKDQKGTRVANGVYYAILRPEGVEGETIVRKVIVLR